MKFTKWAPIAVLFLTYPICPARSESISGALVRAYVTNPDINQQRAATRASDENVSKAVAGYRPQAAVTASLGYNYINSVQTGQIIKGNSFPTNAGVTVTQNLFNGFQTMNGVRQAESNVYQAREATRYTVQNTLQNGATFFMNVLRDAAILELNKNNIVVLEAQLRVTRNRFLLGELTRTDVAQAESSLATARSNYLVAQTNLQNSAASYRQVFGVEPNRLEPARPLDILLPGTLDQAIAISFDQHPAIRAALHNADAAALQVKVNEGQLYPTLSIVGSVAQSNQTSGISADRELNASLIGQLSVPLYSGGATSALIRQSKNCLRRRFFRPTSSVKRSGPPWFRLGDSLKQQKRLSTPRKLRSEPPRSL